MTEPTDSPARSADGCVAAEDRPGAEVTAPADGRAESGELPSRPAPDLPLRRKIRRMDDPEVLERVLAGLLELP